MAASPPRTASTPLRRLSVLARQLDGAQLEVQATAAPQMAQMMTSVAPLLLMGLVQTYMNRNASQEELPELTELERVAEELGFDAERLRLVEQWAQQQISSKKLPGVVLAVSRKGRTVLHEAHGAYGKDSLFAVDMQAPLVTAALLTLVEEGRCSLDDAVATHVPSFAALRVRAPASQVSKDPYAAGAVAPRKATATAAAPMTLRHLLLDTAGLPSALPLESSEPLVRAQDALAAAARLLPGDEASFEAFAASVTLLGPPGHLYRQSGLVAAVAGHVVCRLTGQPLEEAVRQRVLEPLGMSDTHWAVPAEKRERALGLSQAMPYLTNRLWGTRLTGEHGGHNSWLGWVARPAARGFEQGSLWSTASDQLRFQNMLLAGGLASSGSRCLSAESVELMTTDQLPSVGASGLGDAAFNSHARDAAGSGGAAPQFGAEASGQGLALGGLQVVTRSAKARLAGARGTFSSWGRFGTEVWTDPALELTVFVGTQLYPSWALPDLRQELAGGLYGSLVSSPAAKFVPQPPDAAAGGMGGMMNMIMMMSMMGGMGGMGGLPAGAAAAGPAPGAGADAAA